MVSVSSALGFSVGSRRCQALKEVGCHWFKCVVSCLVVLAGGELESCFF